MTNNILINYVKATPMMRLEPLVETNIRTSYKLMLEHFKDQKEIVAAEVGVYEGINAKYMILFCEKLKLHLVDAWDNLVVYTGGPVQDKYYCGIIRAIANINLASYQDKISYTNKNSIDAVKDYPDEFFDYVYIDGDHEHESALKDMRLWFPKVKKGGILGGHDVGMKEVSSALDIFLTEVPSEKNGRDPENNEGRSDFWIFK